MDKTFNKTRLHNQGQIRVPPEIRHLLGAGEGDALLFSTDEAGRVVVSHAQIIDPEQAWFWSDHWQPMEQEARAHCQRNLFRGHLASTRCGWTSMIA